jgi:glycosyltransferase involved in cell wall biosynthesis
MPPLRVLHVIPSVSTRDGGPSRAIGIMERALSEAGVRVTTLTTDHGLASHGVADAPAAVNGAHRIYTRKWLHPYKVAPGLVTHLMRVVRTYDVVHVHALFSFTTTAAALAARHSGVPYIVRPLGSLSRYGLSARRRRLKRLSMALIEGPILRGAAAVHFTSQVELEEAGAIGVPMRGVVIPLGVDAEDGPLSAPLQHAALAGRRVILFLSRLDPMKNLEALIDALALSPALRDSCALVIAGAGEPGYVTNLKARAAAANLSGHTVWLGHVEGARKRAAFAAADVLVLPSFSENFGIVAVEALLAGVPCVLGEGVAIAGAVEQAGAGITVRPQAPAIAQALEHVLGAGPALTHAMSLRARQLAANAFSTAVMARRLIALYEDVRGIPRVEDVAGPGSLAAPRASTEAPVPRTPGDIERLRWAS